MNDSPSPTADPAPAKAGQGAFRRLLGKPLVRYPLLTLASFLAVCAFCAIAVPLLVQQVVLARAGATIGREVTIERVRFNPFTLTLDAHGLRVAGPAPGTDFVDIEALRVDLSIASLRYLAPVIDALTITRPSIHLERTGQRRFDFSDIVDRLRAAPAKPEPPDAKPAHFALHNVELVGGMITLDDRFLKQKHEIRDLRIGVPFISNLDYATDITVQPALSARINDGPFSLTGTSLPFSATRETSVDIVLADLDIATYLRLSPVPLGFKVQDGRLSTDLRVTFSQENGANKLGIRGTSRIESLRIEGRDGGELVAASRISLGLDKVEPLAGRYAFGDLSVDGLDVKVDRAASGELPLVHAFSLGEPLQPAAPATGAAEARGKTPPPAGEAVRWSLRKSRLEGGKVSFHDDAVSPAVQLVQSDIALQLGEIGSQQAAPAPFSLSLTQGERSRLSWQGQLDVGKSRLTGDLEATVGGVEPYRPYFVAAFAPQSRLETGTLDARGHIALDWLDGFKLEVAGAQASVHNARLTLPEEKSAALVLERLAAEGVTVSLVDRSVKVARLSMSGADARLDRNAKGQLNLGRMLASSGAPGAATPDVAAAAPWAVKVDRIDLDRNQVAWRDMTTSGPVNLTMTQIAGHVEQVGSDLSMPSRVDLKARVGSAGTFAAKGDFVIAPWSTRLDLQLDRLPLASVDPYVAERLTLGIEDGLLSSRGQLRLGADKVNFRGRLEVDGLKARERTTSTDAIRWKSLSLDGIDIDVSPATLGPEDRITIGPIALTDFFARVLLTEQGRFNLQDLVRTEASVQAQARAEESRKARQARAAPAAAAEADEGARPTMPAESVAATAPVTKAAPRPGPTIRLGPVQFKGGRSNFTDRFVRPNYSVNLTGLEGGLSAMATDNPAPADVRLSGRIDDEAPIEISGRIDPLAQTLFVDVRAEAKGIDMPKFSPYSGKYIGYTIEKGKLSLKVHYRIAQEQLEAQNRLVLDQLTLGEKVESPDATSLPIQFALGLLKDGNGEIDLNLPIEGSLDDPHFSIGAIIGKAIVNLLTRIVTSPFSALASSVGGDEELSFVEFEPGSAGLGKDALQRLTTLSKALSERPALKLEIAGRVDPKTEKDAMQKLRLEARLRALKRSQEGGAAAADEATPAQATTVGKDEYPELLRRLYEQTTLPDKPRNALGVARTLEVPEMEKLLLAAIDIDAEAVRRLALRRAQVIRDWLAKQGKIASERIYLLGPRTAPEMTGPNRAKPQCQAHCAEFSLR